MPTRGPEVLAATLKGSWISLGYRPSRERRLHFTFDDYVLDSDRRELTRGPVTVDVGPQVFDLLLYLVRNRERVVSKDDLLQVVWAGRVVSESTLTSQISAVRTAIGDSGAEQRLVKTVPRKGFRFVGAVREGQPAALYEAPFPVLPVPDKPSLAVLPFENLSGDAAQDYFIDGVVEEIVSALSRLRWLFVIARNSSFTYKGRLVDPRQAGRELGVRYVLEGSMRKAAHRVRITGQLIDATSGAHIWAERFEGTLDDIFELQDQVAASVVGAIARQLERAEIERASRKATESLDAYDCYLRGKARLNLGTREAIDEGLPMFYKAIELDPGFASAYAMAAWCYFWRKVNGWMTDVAADTAEAIRLGRRAVELGRDDAVALTRGGHALAIFQGDLESGIAYVDRALALDPNLVDAWFLGGFLLTEHGDPEKAIEYFRRAMRFSPLDPEIFRIQAGLALAHFFAGHYDEASSWAEKACRELPAFLVALAILAASHARAGRTSDAKTAARRLKELDPSFRTANLAKLVPIRRPEDLVAFADGLHKAGVS
jgi:TolB-like protein